MEQGHSGEQTMPAPEFVRSGTDDLPAADDRRPHAPTPSHPHDSFERAAALKRAGEPFVLATVVWSQRPTSAQPGAKGIITPDGALFGWVGGSCAQPTVVREAQRALEDGQPRILHLSPEGGGDPARPGVVVAPLTCHSGGTIEVFLEPIVPPLQLVVAGESPVADALLRLGRAMGYRTVAARPGATDSVPREADVILDKLDWADLATQRRSVAVVASMGVYDEEAIERSLRAGASFVALVASKRRFEVSRELLQDSGLSAEQLARLKAPAGLDISASTPEEIAVSILAEIIARKATYTAAPSVEQIAPEAVPETAIDPVCGMTVEIATARHTYDHEGQRFYFCCPGCRKAFAKAPEQYLTQSA